MDFTPLGTFDGSGKLSAAVDGPGDPCSAPLTSVTITVEDQQGVQATSNSLTLDCS